MFGFLIFIHEFGHYITARLCKVQINEFSIGMGPKLFGFRSKKTGILYALRILPIGGYVSMEGENGNVEGISAERSAELEDGESAVQGSEDAEKTQVLTEQAKQYREKCAPFNQKNVWQRILITVAGGVTNVVIGALIMIAYISTAPAIGGTVVAEFANGAVSNTQGLMELDEIVSVDGTKVDTSTYLLYEISQTQGKPCKIVVNRGKYVYNDEKDKIVTNDKYDTLTLEVTFGQETEQGVVMGIADFTVFRVQKTFATVMRQSWSHTVLAGKMVWESLIGLITGRYGLQAMSGPIGTGEVIGQAASYGISQFLYLVALISVNLGIANLLPIPALDGGRLAFQVVEIVRRKPVSEQIEGRIHMIGLLVLMALMIIIALKDTIGIFAG